MKTNFRRWLESQDFDTWLKHNMNMDLKNFADIGAPFQLPSNALTGKDGKPGDKLANLIPYDVEPSKDGKVYKVTDKSDPDPHDPEKSRDGLGGVTHKGGEKKYLRAKDSQNFALFPKQPQQPGGMPGMGGPPGMPPM